MMMSEYEVRELSKVELEAWLEEFWREVIETDTYIDFIGEFGTTRVYL